MLFLFIALIAALLILGGIIFYQVKQVSKLQELHYKEKEEIFNDTWRAIIEAIDISKMKVRSLWTT